MSENLEALTDLERAEVSGLRERVDRLRIFLTNHPSPKVDAPLSEWHNFLFSMKMISGNTSNDMSLVACLRAKQYLCRQLAMFPFDVSEKPQGASGLDIDERTIDNKRVIGEVKSTTPYAKNDFGSAQKKSFLADFRKLNAAEAEYKFLFVTDETYLRNHKTPLSN